MAGACYQLVSCRNKVNKWVHKISINLLILSLFNNQLQRLYSTEWEWKMIMNGKLVWILIEAAVVYSKVISLHASEDNEEVQKILVTIYIRILR